MDRKKDMVLSGGRNVYPADIKIVMLGHPAALTAWTNERVGRQQRISGVVLRDSLPRNPNGKILKRELRAELARA